MVMKAETNEKQVNHWRKLSYSVLCRCWFSNSIISNIFKGIIQARQRRVVSRYINQRNIIIAPGLRKSYVQSLVDEEEVYRGDRRMPPGRVARSW